MPLHVAVRTLGPSTYTLRVTGELDVATAPVLRAAIDQLLERGCLGLVVDLSPLTFLDSSGLGLFLRVLRDLSLRQGTLVLSGLNAEMRDLFRITGTRKLFEFVDPPGAAEFRVRNTAGRNGLATRPGTSVG